MAVSEKQQPSKDIKDVEHDGSGSEKTASVLKTTKDGIVLHPQPSSDPDQPLNWSWRKKHLAFVVLIFETFLVKYTATFIAPGAHTLAADFHTTAVKGTYLASATSIVPAFAPLIWIPLSQRIGRRPVLLAGTILSMCFNIGLANSQTYAQALICRLLGYATASAGLCITPAAISDMFFFHEKGTRMGLNAYLMVVAPYLGGVTGGSIQFNPHLGWRWAMYIAAIMYAVLLIAIFFFVPETIWIPKSDDHNTVVEPTTKKSLYKRLGFKKITPTESWAMTFTRPYTMFAYPAVLLPSIWFSVCYMAEVCNTAGFPLNFGITSKYHFNTRQVGFCSFSGFIGASLAEGFAGPVCDLVARRHLRKGKVWVPEALLKVCWTGAVAIPVGLLIYGLMLNYSHSWVGTLAGISIYAFGQEVLVTVLMTYMTDCYPGQAAEVAVVFQFCLNVMAYHPPFYTPLWIAATSAKVPYIVYSILPVVLFAPCIGLLMLKGPEIRKKGPWGKRKFEDAGVVGEGVQG